MFYLLAGAESRCKVSQRHGPLRILPGAIADLFWGRFRSVLAVETGHEWLHVEGAKEKAEQEQHPAGLPVTEFAEAGGGRLEGGVPQEHDQPSGKEEESDGDQEHAEQNTDAVGDIDRGALSGLKGS